MKILLCDNTLWGLVNFRGPIIRHFLEQGHQVVLVAPEKEDRQMRADPPAGARYVPIRMGRTSTNPLSDLRLLHQLRRIYRHERPDYIFHYTIKPNIYGTLAAHSLGIPSTAMMAGMGYVFSKQSLATRLARVLYRIGLSRTRHLLLLNESNREAVLRQRLCQERKIVMLPGGEGVDCQHFASSPNAAEQTTFLFIGRLLWDKGYEEFVRAAELVKKEHPEARFALLGSLDPSFPGSVPYQRVEADQRRSLTEYRGFRTDMTEVYREPGLVVTLPSYYGEGMNRSLMEACATGKPIITTDIAGCRELVQPGQNGYIVPPRDAQALAQAMLRYLNLSAGQKEAFSQHSRRLALQRFDIEHVKQVYDQIIKQMHDA